MDSGGSGRISVRLLMILVTMAALMKTMGQDVAHALSEPGILGEYCQFDTLEARCPDGHVILIEQAYYGRMHSGRCIKGEGYTGCGNDVKLHLENQCSGRRGCDVKVADLSDLVQPCEKKDFVNYLEATYKCLPVSMGPPDACRGGENHVTTTEPMGFISSLVALDHGYGMSNCPWVIQVPRGQHIQLSVSYYQKYRPSQGSGGLEQGAVCPWQVIIEENETYDDKELCGYDTRARPLHTSENHVIKLTFQQILDGENIPTFVVRYQATGCADIVPQSHAIISRDGDDLKIRCNHTKETWFLTCKNDQWVGPRGNCTMEDKNPVSKRIFGTSIPFPQGLVVAIVLGVLLGVLIGVTSLGIFYIVRKRSTQTSRGVESGQGRPPAEERLDPGHKQPAGYGSKGPGGEGAPTRPGYASRQGAPPPDYSGPGMGYGRRSHVYETPRLPGETTAEPGKVYFELEADQMPQSKST